jgi:4-amino-4-deoxy-L-arabinose transferase-like glycosyltransferase
VKLLLCVIVVLTLLPRMLMAFRLAVICSDGTYYVALAEALERGDISQALNMQFNIFPVVLAALHKLGLTHEVAAKVWGVTMSTLVVLPLFGWIRRQFDERIATIACLLYAVHPEMIEWSPEVVREPTFWFTFTLSIYLLWRAVAEVRVGWFLLAGLSITASALTRFEGLFLLVPLVMWTGMRLLALHEQRLKLVFGAIACPLALPLLLLIVNACWLHHASSASLLRLEPLKRVEQWAKSLSNRTVASEPTLVAAADTTEAIEPLPIGSKRKARPTIFWAFVHTLERGLTPFFGLLVLGGSLAWWRLFLRRDQLPPLFVGLLVVAGIWVHLWYTNQTSGRYVMSIVLLSSRGAALGLVSLAHKIRLMYMAVASTRPNLLRSPTLRSVTRPWVVVAASLFMLTVIGWFDALSTRYQSREMSAELGDWIRYKYGERRVICGVDEQLAIISYHAHANYWEPPRGVTGQAMIDLVNQIGNQTELILIGNGTTRMRDFTKLLETSGELGFQRIDPAMMPDPGDRAVLLSRVPMMR